MEPEIPDFKEQKKGESARRRKQSVPRRNWLKKVGGALIAMLGSWSYLRFEANWLETTSKTIALEGIEKGAKIRILHLSDLHLSESVPIDSLKLALEESLRQNPDVMLITGDFITDKLPSENFRELATSLAKYARQVPTFACLGNHDGGKWAQKKGGYDSPRLVKTMLASAKVNLLENKSQRVFIKGQPFVLSGVGDYWSKSCLPQACLRPLSSPAPRTGEPTILLCHNPDAKELLENYRWDLMLCGHTHGGQFRIPFLGYAPFAPVVDRSMTEGLHQWKGRTIHVTRGIGNLYGIRLNCRPEISILDLVST